MSKIIIAMILVGAACSTVWVVAPSEKVVYRNSDKAESANCSLPIKVGDYGYIQKGKWGGFRAKVVGKVVNHGADCAYSTYIQPKKQNSKYYADEIYTNVNADNLMPINGETVK